YRVGTQPAPLGKSLSHFLGHIYIQDLSSMLPALVLDPKAGDEVLDLCAAPGSKTTQLAALLCDRGAVAANDSSKRRLKTLIGNLKRMGAPNAVAFNAFGEQFGNLYFERFDGVLVDPPCSALGTLHKNPEALYWWHPERTRKLAVNQKNLLQSGLKALKPGGVLVYSTCTLTVEENEEVVQFALDRFSVELETVRLPSGVAARPALARTPSQSFAPVMSRARRIYSFDNESDGFFLARFRKLDSFGSRRNRSSQRPACGVEDGFSATAAAEDNVERFFENFGIERSRLKHRLLRSGAQLMAATPDAADFPAFAPWRHLGVPIAHLTDERRVRITTEGVNLLGEWANKNIVELEGLNQLEDFVNRVDIPVPTRDALQVIVRFQGYGIGHGFVQDGRLISRFPRTGWEFELRKQA
ncbi:MAG TPA: NOL1/NOP2/sun family putative RNA methylase, partial [Acidobacteriota bacterium]|nr:NOL1/NOP2/sun family putative RNA methylase [Acidobacteriota bacterium]